MKLHITINNDALPPWQTIEDSLREALPGIESFELVENMDSDVAVVEVDGTEEEIDEVMNSADVVTDWEYV